MPLSIPDACRASRRAPRWLSWPLHLPLSWLASSPLLAMPAKISVRRYGEGELGNLAACGVDIVVDTENLILWRMPLRHSSSASCCLFRSFSPFLFSKFSFSAPLFILTSRCLLLKSKRLQKMPRFKGNDFAVFRSG